MPKQYHVGTDLVSSMVWKASGENNGQPVWFHCSVPVFLPLAIAGPIILTEPSAGLIHSSAANPPPVGIMQRNPPSIVLFEQTSLNP